LLHALHPPYSVHSSMVLASPRSSHVRQKAVTERG